MKNFFLSVFILSIFSLSAQQNQEVYPQPKYPELFKTLGTPIMPSDPEWVREMYSATPNFYKIVRLHDEYYKTHLLKKTTHTQNYKHFYRKVSQNHYYDNKGNIIIEDVREDNSNRPRISTYSSRGANRSASGEWTPVAPLETFDENGKTKSAHVNTYAIAQSESNPNIMYMGTETGAVFKSVDKAENWFEVGKYDFFEGTAQAIKVDPKNENIVYVAYDKKFFRTMDGGQTWKLLLKSGWQMDVEVHPTEDIVYLAGNCGLLRSTDKGETWQTIIQYVDNGGGKEDGRVSDIEFKSDDPSTVFVAVSNATINRFEIWKSTDNGLSFSPKTTGWYQPTNPNRAPNMGVGGAQGAKIATTKADPNRVYVLLLGSDVSYAEDVNYIGIFRSDNAGESWTMPYDGNGDGQPDNEYGGPYSNDHWCMSSFNTNGGNYDQGYYNADIDASDTDADVFLVGMLNLFKSVNGGKSYIRYGGYQCDECQDGRYRHPDVQDILIQGSEAWVATDGGVDKYDPNLRFVDAKNKGVTTCDLWGFDQGWNEDVLVGGRYHDGNMAYHENYGNGRTLSLGGGESATGFVNKGENRKVYHDDIGARLIPETLPGVVKGIPNLAKYPNSKGGSIGASEIVNDPRYWNRIYMGKDNKLWKSEDYGQNFTLLHTFGSQGNTVRGIEISREDPKMLFVVHHLGSSVKLWKTTDAGQSWSEVTLPLTTNNYTMSLSDKNELFIAFDRGGNDVSKVYKSTDLGASWQNLTSNALNGHKVLDIETQGGTDGGVYAITKNRVF
ncbi:MAG: hypothetical protein KGV44_02610, partial [Flavobacteriaceae bacterium]|nr:hypothetical protein [Flavobacteriaceae bacterium]